MRKIETKIALNILILTFNPHVSSTDDRIRRQLKGISHVRHIDSAYGYHDSVFTEIRRKGINTLVLGVEEYFYKWGGSNEDLFTRSASFIESIRRDFSRVVIILSFKSAEYRGAFLAHIPGRFDHYLYLLPDSSPDEITSVVERCELWHRRQFRYEVALSFAGEDREFVNQVAAVLKKNGAKVFYDRYEQADLLGKDLYQHFQMIYRDESRYCVIFASSHYERKSWTNHELRQAQSRVFAEQPDYLIPVRLDNTEIPGVNETIGFLDARELSPPQVGDLILQKLFFDSYRKAEPLLHRRSEDSGQKKRPLR
jgi:TIR domain